MELVFYENVLQKFIGEKGYEKAGKNSITIGQEALKDVKPIQHLWKGYNLVVFIHNIIINYYYKFELKI